MQLLADADYEPLGPLVENHELPLLVRKQRVVYVAKVARPDELPVLRKLAADPVIRMPRIMDLLTDDDCVVTIETLINGQNLVERLATHGPFSSEMVQQVAGEVLESLAALAQLGIVHRDVKLSNIVVAQNHYYLIDVNAAREYRADQSTDTRLLGTSGFAAPENYGFAQTDQRSDLYALGIVLNCLLTGHVPVDSQTSLRTITTVQPWQRIITKATALDPKDRYQSAVAMLNAVRGHHHAPTSASPFTKVKNFYLRHRQKIRRTTGILYVVWLVLLVFVGLDQASWAEKVSMWRFEAIVFVFPVFAHYLNVWLYRQWPNVQWHKYRGWLRAAETLVVLIVLSHSD